MGPEAPAPGPTVLLADDHDFMRLGLRLVLEAKTDLVVAGEASDGEEAVALCRDRALGTHGSSPLAFPVAARTLTKAQADRRVRSGHCTRGATALACAIRSISQVPVT